MLSHLYLLTMKERKSMLSDFEKGLMVNTLVTYLPRQDVEQWMKVLEEYDQMFHLLKSKDTYIAQLQKELRNEKEKRSVG